MPNDGISPESVSQSSWFSSKVPTWVIILAAVAKEFRADKIIVSTYGVREGYLYHRVLGGEPL